MGAAWDAYSASEFGKVYDITGKWELIPSDYVDSLGGEQGIRRCCLMVEDKKSILSADPQNYSVDGSAWTLFEYEDNDNITQYAFAYTTFYIAPGSAIGEADGGKIEAGAVDWLQEYVQGYHGRPLTEFDQEEQHFDASLPLNDLMTRKDYRDQIVAFINRVKQRVFEPGTARYDKLPGVLVNLFDAEQLSMLAFDHLDGLKLNTLVGPAAGLADQVEALILYCEQRDKLKDLILGVVHEKPNAAAMLDDE